MSGDVYIVAAARTSLAPQGGALRDLDYDRLGAAAIERCLLKAGLEPDEVDELILSNALGAGGNPARVTALAAGLPTRIAGLSIDRQCAGGLDALLLAGAMITAGQAEIVLAGGAESHSLRPTRLYRDAFRSPPQARDQARFAPWSEIDPDMAEAAQHLAALDGISEERQNAWAVASHATALAAAGRVVAEIANPDGVVVSGDPFTRPLTLQICRRARTLAGTINVANTCVAADGAAFVTVVSGRVFARLNSSHALRLVAGTTLGGDPRLPGIAPVPAIASVLDRGNTHAHDLAAVEVMEAYAVQAIACVDRAGLDSARVNLGGGSLARGHPIGASGAVLAVRLFHELARNGGRGLAAIAAAGGLGTALLVEAVDG
ncbi:MAG: thiolase family protein [Alphaproteobacteria bacterium]